MDRQPRSWGKAANQAAADLASRVDTQTSEVAHRAAVVLAFAVRVLRWPSLALLLAPLPFELATGLLAVRAGGIVETIGLIATALTAAVSIAFGLRRRRILRAVSDPTALGTELGIAVSLSERVDDTRGVLAAVGGGGGWRIFDRLRGLWGGLSVTGRWIDQVGDLPRARYFVPPKIGTTVTLAVAAAWLIPASMLCAVLSVIATVARVL